MSLGAWALVSVVTGALVWWVIRMLKKGISAEGQIARIRKERDAAAKKLAQTRQAKLTPDQHSKFIDSL